MSETILEVKNLKKYFKTSRGMLHAVDDVSFTLKRGKTLGVVGESGCGKSTMGRCVLNLLHPTSGEVIFEGKNIAGLKATEQRDITKEMQIVFQDPYSSLDPRKTIYQTLKEPLLEQGIVKRFDKKALDEQVRQLMDTVGLAERFIDAYPHELDGGRRQRIGIARALAVQPKLIVCDEPVSALDVSIQAQILNLLQELQEKNRLSYIFITHDLSVVNYFSDDILVMYLGQVVEKAPAEELFRRPLHPYTQVLLSAILEPVVHEKRERTLVSGELTSPIEPPDECRFRKRCAHACDRCKGTPPLREITPGHFVACHLVEKE